MNALKKELVSLRIPESLNKKLAEHVAPLGISKNAFILGLIHREILKNAPDDYLAEKTKPAEPAQRKE